MAHSRTSVLAAAAMLADRDGLDALTVSSVARELDVKPPSLYSHVRDAAAIRAGLHRQALAELADLVSAEIAGRAGRDAVAAFVAANRTFATEHPGLWQLLQRPAAPEVAGSDEAVRMAAASLAVLRGYGLDDAESVHAVRFVGATVNGFVTLAATGAFDHRPEDVETSWTRVVDVIDLALFGWPGGAR